jgi:hypothetical protein
MKSLLLLLICASSALAEQVNYYGDDGELVIIRNAKDVNVVVDQYGEKSLQVTPSDNGQTFIYGDELTIIEKTPYGIISY